MERGRSTRIMRLLEKDEDQKENNQANFQTNEQIENLQKSEVTKFKPIETSATKDYLQPDKVFGFPVTYKHYAAITKQFDEFATSQSTVQNIDLDILKTSAPSFLEETTNNTYYEDSDDSVKDKDYFPSDQESSSESDLDSGPTSVHMQTAPRQSYVTVDDHTILMEQQGDMERAPVHMQEESLQYSVTVAEHTVPMEQQGDSEHASVHMQEPPLQSAVTVADQAILMEEQFDIAPALAPLQEKLTSPCTSATTTVKLQNISYTKKGTIRKRKKYDESVKHRQYVKIEKSKRKHAVINTNRKCCKKNCSETFSKSDQEVTNNQFWQLSWREQKIFIGQRIATKDPARRSKPDEEQNKRQMTIKYSLQKNGKDEIVCKEFFLNTLGFKKDNSSAIKSALKFKECYNKDDGRGRKPKPKFDRKLITDHINSYNPTISHYRREHAPNRRYLAPELTIQCMYDDFSEKHEKKCSYDLYRETVKSMNISFAKLGSEECDKCEQYKFHNPEYTLLRHFNCEICKTHDIHLNKSEIARKKYKESSSDPNKAIYTADLQKVIMLPRIDSIKAVIFCPRLVAFNESFVPVGKSEDAPIAVLWHEAISGRKKEDIVSTFRRFFLEMRDKLHITLWLDNCSAQNKNWSLFSYIVYVINSNEIDAQTIVLNYFEPGHTHMSADHFHHQVELAMKKDPKIYDFEDLNKVIQKANHGKVVVIPMSVGDFFEFEDYAAQKKLTSQRPRPYLNDMVQIKFSRGKRTLAYKNMFYEEETELDFIKKCHLKGQLPPPVLKTEPRGIDSTRKLNILQRLSKLMPENRVKFWQDLPTKDGVPNLIVDRDE